MSEIWSQQFRSSESSMGSRPRTVSRKGPSGKRPVGTGPVPMGTQGRHEACQTWWERGREQGRFLLGTPERGGEMSRGQRRRGGCSGPRSSHPCAVWSGRGQLPRRGLRAASPLGPLGLCQPPLTLLNPSPRSRLRSLSLGLMLAHRLLVQLLDPSGGSGKAC